MDTLPHIGQPPCDSQWNQKAHQILPYLQHEDTTQNGRQCMEDIGGNQWLLGALQLSSLSFLRWDRFDRGREADMRRQIHRSVCHLGARRIYSKEVALVPIRRRSKRSMNKPAAAIGTDISKNAFDAGGAEGASIGNRYAPQASLAAVLCCSVRRSAWVQAWCLRWMLSLLGNQWFLEQYSA
jgi:hypothetical protein